MKKRLLSALLALALVFVLLPTTALAGETTGSDYDISINGKGWKFDTDDSGAYIPVYYYANYSFNTDANDNWATNSNLKLTKEGNTVTITIRPKKRHISGNTIEFTLEKKSTTSGIPYDYTPCIEMGNNNNLVITGKGTLNITRDEKNGIGAALCSEVGDITITDGITVKANFLKQVSKSTVGNAISVKDHNLIISGKNTKVEARNSSCNFQDLYYVSATVCVENGEIKVSDGATLSAINNFTNSYTSQYSYYSRAISGSSSKPCALTVTGENSCVIAETDNSLGKAYGYVNFSIDGAKIEVGTSSPAQTITDINDISNYKYAKISVPALQRTSDVFIAGEKAVVGQWTTITVDSCSGSYYYDADKKELTLKDITITRNNNNNVNHAIQFTKNGDYTINLEGANNISSVTDGICALNNAFYDNPANISVTITGTGSLNVIANTYAIDMQVGNLIFNNTGNITLTTNTNYTVQKTVCNALRVKSGSISIDNTKYDIVGARQEKNYPTETISDSSAFTPDLLNGYTVGEETTLFKTITITPAAAKPSTISYDGKTLKQGQTINGENGGKATVSTDGYTITLNNFKGTQALSFEATLADSTLVLEGTSTLSSIVTTQKGLTISGSGSLTAGSIKVHNQKTSSDDKPNLTITGGAQVTVNRPSNEDLRAIDIDGDLTVTNGSLKATSTSTKPTVQVGGNATFTGSTVTITNNSTEPHKDATEATKGDSVSSALYVKGDINITDNANVTAKVENGGGNAIGALGNITVKGSTVTAANRGQKFTTIIAKNVYVSGDSKITANNLNKNSLYNGLYLACPAIEGNIVNKNTDYSLKFEGEHSSSSEPKTTLAPGEQTTLYYYKVAITRGSAYTAPTTISKIIVTGLTPPVKGATPVDKNNVTLTEGLTVESITWGPDLTSDGKFAADTSYTAHIKYSVNAGYELAANANYPQVAGANVTRWHQEGMPQDEIEVTFPKTGGGSTHEHNWDEAWHDLGNGYHAHKCTGCDVYDTATQESHNVTGYRDNYDGSHSKICGSCGYSAKVSHSYTWAPNVNDNEKHIGTCVCGNVVEKYHNFVGDVCQECGYDKSTGTTCEHVWTTEWTIDTVDNEYHWHKCIKCGAIADKEAHAYTIVTDNGTNHTRECECKVFYVEDHISSDWIIDTPATATTAGSKHKECTVCKHEMQTEVIPATGEIEPPTPDNPGTIVIIRPAEEEKPAQQPNPSTGANDLVGMAVAAAVVAVLGSVALLRKHD